MGDVGSRGVVNAVVSMLSGMDASTRWLFGFAAALAVLVIFALALTQIGRDEPKEYAADSPEGVVQRYLQAVDSGDAEAVVTLLSDDLMRPCAADGVRSEVRHTKRSIEGRRISLIGVRELSPERVAVDIRIKWIAEPELFSPPPDESSRDRDIILERRADESWGIAELDWPIYIYDVEGLCSGETTTSSDAVSPSRRTEEP